jgi:hypothetical protein
MKLKHLLVLLIIFSSKAYALEISVEFYTGIDLTDTSLEYSVWVEGKKDSGIGEKIT